MSSKKNYTLEKQDIEECLSREPTGSILCSDSEPKEYEPVWGNMKRMTVMYKSADDFEIEVEELDIPFIDEEEEDSIKNVEQISKTFNQMKIRECRENENGIENLLKPEVKEYLDNMYQIINLKYGIQKQTQKQEADEVSDEKKLL